MALLEQVMLEQNAHWEGQPYAHRLVRLHVEDALQDFKLQEVQVITGIRRCGKSTLLESLINHSIKKVNPKTILYLNLDDPSYIEVCQNASAFYELLTTAEKLTDTTIKYLFLDEVHNVEGWEKFVKSVYDRKRFKKIVVTGSNADLLNSDYATLLSGRYIETRIYPLTYREILLNNGIQNSMDLLRQKARALRLLDGLMKFGGFPQIWSLTAEAEKKKILKSYFETILLKDCIRHHAIRDVKAMQHLAHYLLSNITSLYSYNSLKKFLGINETTVQHFIHILSGAYFVEELTQFSYSLKTQIRARKKPYCIDNGLITAATATFTEDQGKLFENLVYAELRKTGHDRVYFYQDTKECDFVLFVKNKPQLLQVCYRLDTQNRARELAGLMAAMAHFSIKQGCIITYDQEEVHGQIKMVPFWKFFFD